MAPDGPPDRTRPGKKAGRARASGIGSPIPAIPGDGPPPETRTGPGEQAVAKPAIQELRQVAALPTRMGPDGIEVCLITTRETRRWTVPKGWPMKGRKDHRAAAIEAEQEAGLKGRIDKEPVGSFLYFKRRDAHFDLVRTTVYRLPVTSLLKNWREKGQREVRWVPAHEASMMVEEAGLSAIIATLC